MGEKKKRKRKKGRKKIKRKKGKKKRKKTKRTKSSVWLTCRGGLTWCWTLGFGEDSKDVAIAETRREPYLVWVLISGPSEVKKTGIL